MSIKRNLKIAVIGAGSTYTPELIDLFIKKYSEVPVSEIYLMDIDEAKLSIVGNFIKRMAENIPAKITAGTSLDDALKNSDFIILQIRTEGLRARHRDETLPLPFGCIGQETTGAGGFACALRTIPDILHICKKAEELCPEGWIINFTNPSGIITEAISKYSKMKVVGLCNIPIYLKRKIAESNGIKQEDIDFDYVGLNHLSWILKIKGKDSLTLPSINIANLPDIPIEEEIIKSTGFIPSPYLRYYYHHDKILQEQLRSEKTRAEKVMDIEKHLLEIYSDENLKEKPKELEERGGACYSEAAFSIISSMLNNKGEEYIVNIPNGNTLDNIEEDSIVEIPARFYFDKYIRPGKIEVPIEIRSLILSVKTYENLTVEASVKNSKKKALMALMAHPLIGQYEKALPLLNCLIKENNFKLE